jgi:O-antigen/teichoic acid export membrane protein
MNLRRHAFVAVGSSAALSLIGDLVRLATMMVMARLLTPEDYGTFALASSVMLWVGAAGFENFAPNLLREQGGDMEIGTYLLFGLLLQTALLLLGMAIAGILYFWFDLQLVALLLVVGLLAFPLKAPRDIELQLLQREFFWKRLRLVQLGMLLLGSVSAVALAYAGAGPFALVASILLEPLPFACLLVTSRSLGPLRLDRDLLRRVQAFGWPMVGGTQTYRTREVVGSWAVGTILGAAELGLLGRAMGLATLVLGRFAGQVTYALLPILAAAQGDPERRLRVGSLLLRAIVWSQLPLAVSLALLAAPAVDLLYGARWTDIVPLLPLASALAFGEGLLTLFVPFLIASGATGDRLKVDALHLALALLALGALPYGLPAYILGQTAAISLASIASAVFVRRRGWIDRRGFCDALVPAVQASSAAAVPSVLALCSLTGTFGRVLAATAFVVTYVLTLRLVCAPLVRELLDIFPGAAFLRRAAFLHATSKSTVSGAA